MMTNNDTLSYTQNKHWKKYIFYQQHRSCGICVCLYTEKRHEWLWSVSRNQLMLKLLNAIRTQTCINPDCSQIDTCLIALNPLTAELPAAWLQEISHRMSREEKPLSWLEDQKECRRCCWPKDTIYYQCQIKCPLAFRGHSAPHRTCMDSLLSVCHWLKSGWA